jgi:hypothetical protein
MELPIVRPEVFPAAQKARLANDLASLATGADFGAAGFS